MNKRPFGSTGIEVSELVFGGGMVGGLLIEADDETRRTAVDMAISGGINWFDTAASYGQGRSETALGWLLSERAESVNISTKFAIDTRNLRDLTGQIEASLTASLERLQRNSVTLLQLHNHIGEKTAGRVLAADDILQNGGVLDALEGFKAQGLIEHFGITALGEPESICRVIETGRIASAQVYYNLLNPSAGRQLPPSWPVFDFTGVLAACEQNGVAAMNIRVLSAGVIASDARKGRERPLTPGDTVETETAKTQAMFAALSDRFGTRAQTAIRFALAEPRLSCIVVGLAELAHLREALAAAAMGPLDAAALSAIEAAYQTGGDSPQQ